MHRTKGEARRAEVRALRKQGGGSGGIRRVKKDGTEYFDSTVKITSTNPRKRRNQSATATAARIKGWMPARAVKIVRNSRGQATAVKIKT